MKKIKHKEIKGIDGVKFKSAFRDVLREAIEFNDYKVGSNYFELHRAIRLLDIKSKLKEGTNIYYIHKEVFLTIHPLIFNDDDTIDMKYTLRKIFSG